MAGRSSSETPDFLLDRPTTSDDPLGLVLATVRMTAARYCASRLGSPWGISFAARRCAMFHAVDDGACWVRVAGVAEPLRMTRGDLVLLPHGDEHALVDQPHRAARRVDFADAPRCGVERRGGDGPASTIVCGELHLDGDHAGLLSAALPRVILVPCERADLLDATLQLLAREVAADRPAAGVVVTRLAEVLFVQALRRWVDTSDAQLVGGWLAGLKDVAVHRALGAMHARPAEPWTVDALAREARLSRSAFAARFQQAVGAPPLQHLTRWRMHLACQALRRDPERSVEAVAADVGYASASAFHRTFARVVGMTPRAARTRPEGSGMSV